MSFPSDRLRRDDAREYLQEQAQQRRGQVLLAAVAHYYGIPTAQTPATPEELVNTLGAPFYLDYPRLPADSLDLDRLLQSGLVPATPGAGKRKQLPPLLEAFHEGWQERGSLAREYVLVVGISLVRGLDRYRILRGGTLRGEQAALVFENPWRALARRTAELPGGTHTLILTSLEAYLQGVKWRPALEG